MLKLYTFLLTVVTLLTLLTAAIVEDKSNKIVSFPYEVKPCSGKGALGAVCCQGVLVNTIGFNKTVCVEFQLKIYPVRADVKISIDDKLVAEFSIDPTKPPKYCVPVVLPVPVAMCIQLHDIKLIDYSALQICSTVYVSYNTSQVVNHKLPCVKLSSKGIEKM